MNQRYDEWQMWAPMGAGEWLLGDMRYTHIIYILPLGFQNHRKYFVESHYKILTSIYSTLYEWLCRFWILFHSQVYFKLMMTYSYDRRQSENATKWEARGGFQIKSPPTPYRKALTKVSWKLKLHKRKNQHFHPQRQIFHHSNHLRTWNSPSVFYQV